MGIFEILLIAVIALLVVGPEKMPEAVRSVALTVGRIKRLFSNAKSELEKQVGADEIRQQLHNEAVMDQLAREDSERAKTAKQHKDSIDDANVTPADAMDKSSLP